MKRAVILTPLLIIMLTGCTLGEMLRLTPQGQRESAAIQANVDTAYVLGENRGFQMTNGKAENQRELLTWRGIQTTIDAEIVAIASATDTPYTTGRLSMILRANGVDENAAQAVVEELNSVLSEQMLLASAYAGTERRRIIQSYLQGFFDGTWIALPVRGQ